MAETGDDRTLAEYYYGDDDKPALLPRSIHLSLRDTVITPSEELDVAE